MPSTPKQMRTAGREMQLRREGKVTQEQSRAAATRPMGAMSDKNLRAYASWPNPAEQKALATKEINARESGKHTQTGFAKATDASLKFYATATDKAIRKRNGQG